MKKIITKNVLALFCTAGLFSLLLTSCTKIPMNVNTNAPTASITVLQALPDQNPLDVVIDNTRVNQSGFYYGESSGYITLTTGNGTVVFYDDVTSKPILADTINFVAYTNYSLFLVSAANKPAAFLLTDTLTKPAAGNASVRFVDVSPDAPAVDLVVKGGSTLVSNRSFKGFSSFAPITPNTYTFEVHQAGTATVLATMPNVKLNANYVYTIWFHGFAAGATATDKLSLDIVNNIYYP